MCCENRFPVWIMVNKSIPEWIMVNKSFPEWIMMKNYIVPRFSNLYNGDNYCFHLMRHCGEEMS